MSIQTILQLLTDYKANKARYAYLEIAIIEFQEQIDSEERNILRNEVMSSPEQDGMPKGNAVTSQVENLVVRVVDGWTPEYLKEMQKDMRDLMREKEELRRKVGYVDAWMLALNEKQRWIIQTHIIDGMSWTEAAADWRKRYEGVVSKATLKRLKNSAMDVIEKCSIMQMSRK